MSVHNLGACCVSPGTKVLELTFFCFYCKILRYSSDTQVVTVQFIGHVGVYSYIIQGKEDEVN